MKNIFEYILSAIFYTFYTFLLFLFHPIQIVSRHLGGYSSHKKSVDYLNYFLLAIFRFLGARIKISGTDNLPTDKPLIIVSNHQSTFDITPLVVGFRKHHVKFISKKELGKNIPSVSYNLRHGGSALIDRKNGRQSIMEIVRLGRFIEKNNYAACIFPEGTRSKNGKLRKFHEGGFSALLKTAPSAVVVPFVIDGNYRLHIKGMFPLRIGLKLNYTALEPISQKGLSSEEILLKAEEAIKIKLGQLN